MTIINGVVVNLAWQLGGNHVLLEEAAEGADVMLVCEALRRGGRRPYRLRGNLPNGWLTMQDTSSCAKAGSAVCWNSSTMLRPWGHDTSLIRMSGPGIGVRSRYLAYTMLAPREQPHLWRGYGALHAPLRRTLQQGRFYRRFDRFLDNHELLVAGLDANRSVEWLRDRLDRDARGAGVIAVTAPRGLIVNTSAHRLWASDHKFVRFQIEVGA